MLPPISPISRDDAPGPPLAAAIEAAFAWWREAGVDGDWVDAPQDWLAHARPALAAAVATPETAQPASAPLLAGGSAAWPVQPAAFAPWWMAQPDLAPVGAARIAPSGPEEPALMVVVPMPEAGDTTALLSGPAGRLLDGFLAAAGLGRTQVYCASALPTRFAAPDWAVLAQAGWGDLLTHHIALVRPQRVMLFGQNGISTLIGNVSANNPLSLPLINHGEAMVPVLWAYDLESIVARPALKAGLWIRWLDWTST